MPATGAGFTAPQDNCDLHDGASKAFLANRYDATGAAAAGSIYSKSRAARNIGSKRANPQVLTDRSSTNAGTAPSGAKSTSSTTSFSTTAPPPWT